jgi:hypothetical protein
LTLPKKSTDWINYSSQGDFDNWYHGSALNQSLASLVFNIRGGVPLPAPYGTQPTSGLVKSAWDDLAGIVNQGSSLAKLARAVMHASVFQTAFHTQPTNPANLTKFTDGSYVYPDTTFDNVIDFARVTQAQTRMAAVYARVDTWATAALGGAYNSTAVAAQEDVDLDGENEYLLFNDRVFAIFERIGGRMTAAWARDIASGAIVQAIGNHAGYANTDTELEGEGNASGSDPVAFRTSGLKDWFAVTNSVSGAGTSRYINDLYAAAAAPSGTGWQFTSPDGKVVKRVTLPAKVSAFTANYTLGTGITKLYVRAGLSPNLYDLLLHGQQNLGGLINDGQAAGIANNSAALPVRAYLQYAGGTNNAAYNPGATDDNGSLWDSVPMRNQAQTHQVELEGASGLTFQLGFETGTGLNSDQDGDGLPDGWEYQYGLDWLDASGVNGADGDPDGDDQNNLAERASGTLPLDAGSALRIVSIERITSTSYQITWASVPGKSYRVMSAPAIDGPYTQLDGIIPGTPGATTSFTHSGVASPVRFYKVLVLP